MLPPDELVWIAPEDPNWRTVARDYIVLGFSHIWEGPDHLMFVAGLILLARRPKRILLAVTGFTAAHSITLSLATLDLVHLPIPPVEAMIALSILFLAGELARKDSGSFSHRFPIALSFTFGLLHGFDFASALGEIGLPRGELAVGLVFFNLGVEFGQIAFIAAAGALVLAALRLHALGHVAVVQHRAAHVVLGHEGRQRLALFGHQLPELLRDLRHLDLLDQRLRQTGVTLAHKTEIHRKGIGGLQHPRHIKDARGAGRRVGTGCGTGAAAEHRRNAGCKRLLDLLRRDEVDMRVDAAGRHDPALTGNDFGSGTDDDVDAVLRIGIAGLANRTDLAVADTDVGLDDTPVVENQCIGYYRIHHILGDALTLPHTVADHLTATKFDFVAVGSVILFNFDD